MPLQLIFLAVLLVLVVNPARAAGLEEDHAALEPFESATFEQERHVAALSRPLRSSGVIELSESGFVWKQQFPFEVWLSYDGEQILEKTVVGATSETREVVDPATVHMTRTIYDLMSGSLADLETAFEIVSLDDPGGTAWRYSLQPREAAVRQAIQNIIIGGDDQLQDIRIEESADSFITIELTGQRPAR